MTSQRWVTLTSGPTIRYHQRLDTQKALDWFKGVNDLAQYTKRNTPTTLTIQPLAGREPFNQPGPKFLGESALFSDLNELIRPVSNIFAACLELEGVHYAIHGRTTAQLNLLRESYSLCHGVFYQGEKFSLVEEFLSQTTKALTLIPQQIDSIAHVSEDVQLVIRFIKKDEDKELLKYQAVAQLDTPIPIHISAIECKGLISYGLSIYYQIVFCPSDSR